MKGMNSDGELIRPALGRVAFIGELYDARTGSFSSRSLLKSPFPYDIIKSINIGNTQFDYKSTNSASERSELLKVQAELQVSVCLGLVTVDGSGQFLTEEQHSENSVSCSLICRISTVCEKFFASFENILGHIDMTALEDQKNTHVVTEIKWGANILLTLGATGASQSDKEVLKGQLSGKLEKLKQVLSVQGKGELDKKKSFSESSDDISIKVCADVVPDEGWPTSIDGFCRFMMRAPELLKNENGGKGKPLDYTMIPLSDFRGLAKLSNAIETAVISIDESFLTSIMCTLEELALIRRKLHDLLEEMTNLHNYAQESDLKLAKKHKQTLVEKESELKLLISGQWVKVKSGEKSLKDLVKEVESFKTRSLKLHVYTEYLESTTAIQEKLAMVKHLISLGVIYLGKGDTFESVLLYNISSEFLVLLMSSKTKEEDSELHINTFHYFLTEASDPRPNTKYVVVDFDLKREHIFMNVRVSTSRIFHLNGGNILSKDKYAEYLAESVSNFVRVKNEAEVVHMTHKPGNRVPVEMICPGFQEGTCPADLLSWTCFRCKSSIEYGFDGFYYCPCGKVQIADMEYRCSDTRHGDKFVAGRTDFIQTNLASLKPLKEINILILGSSGVGKSTWINSIVNYLNFETLDEAKEKGVICTIPTRLVFYGGESSKKQYIIDIGTEDKNEVTSIGDSATQVARTYSFIWEGKCVRLIDTPGVGDTRGIEQDQLNLKNIISHVGHLKELHGVCILFKANDNKINTFFSYCFKELLVHLHRSITKNIVFCFTNARASLYKPGQISILLENLIRELGAEKELPLGLHNMFCLENEAFNFLCTLTNPEITYDAHIVDSFRHSWEGSLNETRRLFETIASFTPHELKETLSLVKVRSRIMSLSKPVAEISKTIQINLSTIQRKQEDLMTTNQTLEELSKKLHYEEVYLESVPLNYPRTVCTSPSCVEYLSFENLDVREIEYKTHCHNHCYLTNVEALTVNNSRLRGCDAMESGKCKNCGCGWENHMHITESQRRKVRKMVNQRVENEMMKEKSEKEKIECLVKDLESLVEKYKEEQEFIIQASVKFGMFLRRNAITVFNDSVAEYMQYLIKEEEKKEHKSTTEKNLLERLRETLAHYNAEVTILTDVIKKGENNNEELSSEQVLELSSEQVLELEQQLYLLELTGENIRQSVECSRNSHDQLMQYTEIPLQIPHNPREHLATAHSGRPNNKAKSKFSLVKEWMGKKNPGWNIF